MDTSQTLVIEDDSSADEHSPESQLQDSGKPQSSTLASVKTGKQRLAQRHFIVKPRKKQLMPLSVLPRRHRVRSEAQRKGHLSASVDAASHSEVSGLQVSKDIAKQTLRQQFKLAFPVGERQIPLYDAFADKHVRMHKRQHAPSAEASKVLQRGRLKLPLVRRTAAYSGKALTSCRQDPDGARDWGRSVLDGYASAGVYTFNPDLDPGLFTEDELNQLLETLKDQPAELPNLEQLLGKSSRTLDRLKEELLLSDDAHHPNAHSFRDDLLTRLLQCHSHFQTRRVVVEILRAIHDRESCQLSLLRTPVGTSYKEFVRHSHSILSATARLKAITGDPGFRYLGSDYVSKIYRDAERLPDAWRN